MDESSLWYVAYGSNLFRARFACYLSGGRPDGGAVFPRPRPKGLAWRLTP
ncbi:hypothetical protein [Actinomadura verrucosospora]|nr:hypothetical protein [Actinomadura verrucosospora]